MGLFDGMAGAASTGATLGSAFGPVGSAIGGVGGAIASGVGSLLGTASQNQQNYQSQLDQYYYNSGLMQQSQAYNTQNATTAFNRSQEQLNETEQYNTQMANTAFQRQVADLKAAGLNPILGMGTSGAPSPTASAAPPASPTVGAGSVGMPSYQSAMGNAVSSALQGFKAQADVASTNADIQNKNVQNRLIGAQADKATAEATATPELLRATISQSLAAAGYSNSAATAAANDAALKAAQTVKTNKETTYVGADTYTGAAGIPGLVNGTVTHLKPVPAGGSQPAYQPMAVPPAGSTTPNSYSSPFSYGP